MSDSILKNEHEECTETYVMKIILFSLLSLCISRLIFVIFNRDGHRRNSSKPASRRISNSQHQTFASKKNCFRKEINDNGVDSLLNKLSKLPPHHRPINLISKNTKVFQHHGFLPYNLTHAYNYQQTFGKKILLSCRKDRALVFARLFRGTSICIPPIRGSLIVVAIPLKDIGCKLLTKIIFLFATYYNLFLMLNIKYFKYFHITETLQYSQELKYLDRITHKLRYFGNPVEILVNDSVELNVKSYILSDKVLPLHRIIAHNSMKGRVSFVRQLPQRPSFVLDYRKEVKADLEKFGFKVIMYDNSIDKKMQISGIGKKLLA